MPGTFLYPAKKQPSPPTPLPNLGEGSLDLEVDTFVLGLECEARHGGTPPAEKFISLNIFGGII